MDKHRANSFTITGLTGAVALAGGTQAYGAVVQGIAPPSTVLHSTAIHGLDHERWDIDGNGTPDFLIGANTFPAYPQYGLPNADSFGGFAGYNTPTTGNGVASTYLRYAGIFGKVAFATDFAPGTSVGPTTQFKYQNGNYTFLEERQDGVNSGQFSTVGYSGFKFMEADGLHYGFVEFGVVVAGSTNADATCTITYLGSEYETVANTPIVVSAIPEPGSLAALAFGMAGAAGAAISRRRRPEASPAA